MAGPLHDLSHFREAQDPVRARVTAELAAGRKQSHWIWFVFPQLTGLGRSPTAQFFGLRDLDHARRYLRDAVLGARLREDVQTLLPHHELSAHDIFGSPDDVKLRSCLTLFERAAESDTDRRLFEQALQVFFGGERDAVTLSLLAKRGE